MSPTQIFAVANFAALCGWLLLIVLPGKRWVTHLISGVAIPAAFAALYIVIIAIHLPAAKEDFPRCPMWRSCSAIGGCSSPGGFITSHSICSSEAGRYVMRASVVSLTCSSSPA